MVTEFDPNAAAAPDSGIFGLSFTPEQAELVLVPVPWEATTSYGGGTAAGPAAILAASHQVDLFDQELGRLYERGIAMLESPRLIARINRKARAKAKKIIAAGGVLGESEKLQAALVKVNEWSEQVNTWVQETTAHWLARGKIVGVVGGDHSVPFGAIQAYGETGEAFGILHLDAHSDTRRAYEGFEWSHASIMENVLRKIPQVKKIVQVGIRDMCEEEMDRIRGSGDRLALYSDDRLNEARFAGQPWKTIVEEIVEELPRAVYLSFDIDGLDPALCPHTGTPVPGGLSFAEAVSLVRRVVRSGRRIIGFDLNEVAPGPEDEWDANVGARLLYKMCLWALASAHPV
jgi:agmatinase